MRYYERHHPRRFVMRNGFLCDTQKDKPLPAPNPEGPSLRRILICVAIQECQRAINAATGVK